jgi:dihydroxyacid dehydratase/phosphogluconate dehydratase
MYLALSVTRVPDLSVLFRGRGQKVLHVVPESYVGSPPAFVQDGDVVELDVPARRLNLQVSEDELAKRRAEWQQPPPKYRRGYGQLYLQHITQANEGCDFDFLKSGMPTSEPEIH